MLISSTATMTADPATAYAAFHDETILAATIPGVESFTRTGEDAFDVILTMGVAAIKGTYKGTVEFSAEVPDTSFVLSAKGAGGPGTIGADISVTLAPDGNSGSDITWAADAVLGGPIGGVGQRMLGSVAKRIAKKFFADIDAAIRDGVPDASTTEDGAVGATAAGVAGVDTAALPAGTGIAASQPSASQPSANVPSAVPPAALAAPCAADGTGVTAGSLLRGDGFLAGAVVGAGAALLGVCLGILAGRR